MTIESKERELRNCAFVKLMLMVIIVFYHSIIFWNGTWAITGPKIDMPTLVVLSKWLNSFHIYAFVLVSGYIFCYLKYESGKYQKLWPFVVNKAKRLLIPYIGMSVFWVWPISAILGVGSTPTVEGVLSGVAGQQLWFLLMLFGVFIIYWLLSDYLFKHHIVGIAVILCAYGIGCGGRYFLPELGFIWLPCTYLIFFWSGVKIRQFGTGTARYIPRALIWIIVDIILFLILEQLPVDGMLFRAIRAGGNLTLHCVGAIMAFYVLQGIAERYKWDTRWMRFVEQRSMAVYLFHQQIIYMWIILLNGIIHPYFHVTINFSAALIISLILSSICLKFKCTRILIGEG